MIYFISRHSAAIQWIERQDIKVDKILTHLDIKQLRSEDIVLGSLPVNLAAEVCAIGANYWHLVLDTPAQDRGRELSINDMYNLHARLIQFKVQKITGEHKWQ